MIKRIRPLLLLVSAIGTLLFGTLFSTSLLNPLYVEQTAKDIIRHEIENTVNEKINPLDERFLIGKASELLKKHQEETKLAREKLRAKLPEQIATLMAEMRNLDCECRKKIEHHYREKFELEIGNSTQIEEKLKSLIRSKYMDTAGKLTREFRIFTGANAVVFALLGLATLFRRSAQLSLVPAATVLLAASAITGYFYLFNQNWLHTILYSDYLGLGYFIYLSLVFALLSDVVFNHARVTLKILSSMGAGSSSALPC